MQRGTCGEGASGAAPGTAALLGDGARTGFAPLPPGGVPGSGLHFRLSAAPDPDLYLRPAPLTPR